MNIGKHDILLRRVKVAQDGGEAFPILGQSDACRHLRSEVVIAERCPGERDRMSGGKKVAAAADSVGNDRP